MASCRRPPWSIHGREAARWIRSRSLSTPVCGCFARFRGAQGAWPPREATFQAAARRIADAGLVLMADLGNPIGELTEYIHALGDLDLTIVFANVTYATLGEALTVMRSDPRVHLESHRLCRPDTLELIASEVGADRVLFGTSGPPFNALAALNLVLHANLPEPDRRLMLAGNALRLIEGREVADRATPDLTPNAFGPPVRGPETVPIIDIHAHNGAWPYAGATSRENHGIATLERLMTKYNVEQTFASSALAITNDFRRGNRELVEGSRGRGHDPTAGDDHAARCRRIVRRDGPVVSRAPCRRRQAAHAAVPRSHRRSANGRPLS